MKFKAIIFVGLSIGVNFNIHASAPKDSIHASLGKKSTTNPTSFTEMLLYGLGALGVGSLLHHLYTVDFGGVTHQTSASNSRSLTQSLLCGLGALSIGGGLYRLFTQETEIDTSKSELEKLTNDRELLGKQVQIIIDQNAPNSNAIAKIQNIQSISQENKNALLAALKMHTKNSKKYIHSFNAAYHDIEVKIAALKEANPKIHSSGAIALMFGIAAYIFGRNS